ncbi:unnamed protein product, partial [Sphagnum troendelagicum]
RKTRRSPWRTSKWSSLMMILRWKSGRRNGIAVALLVRSGIGSPMMRLRKMPR